MRPSPLRILPACLLALGGLHTAAPAAAGETPPTCIRAGQCFVTRNVINGPVAGDLYTTSASGQLFGIAGNRVTSCWMVSAAYRDSGRVRYGEVNCLAAVRQGGAFSVFPFDNYLVNATCGNPTRLESRLTLKIDGVQHTGAVATHVARPCTGT